MPTEKVHKLTTFSDQLTATALEDAELLEREKLTAYTRKLYAEDILGKGVPRSYGLPLEPPYSDSDPIELMPSHVLTEKITEAAGYLHLYTLQFKPAYDIYQSLAADPGIEPSEKPAVVDPARKRIAFIRLAIMFEWNTLQLLETELEKYLTTPGPEGAGARKDRILLATEAHPAVPDDTQ